METVLSTGKKKVYSDWTLMQCYFETDGTLLLSLADKHSNDSIRFSLEGNDIERLRTIFKRPAEAQTQSKS